MGPLNVSPEPCVNPVRRALLSVFDKTGLVEFAAGLHAAGVEIIASGGTAHTLAAAGIPIQRVEDLTGAKEVLGGRVKTLHPRVHAGILADRRSPEHMADLEANGYPPIDMVICTLYPFQEALAKGGDRPTLTETIDIGGPTLVRAAAKNCDGGVTVVVDPQDYPTLLRELSAHNGCIQPVTRRHMAAKAFRMIAAYDLAIATWTASDTSVDAGTNQGDACAMHAPVAQKDPSFPAGIGPFIRKTALRYGENPHQQAYLYVAHDEQRGVAWGTQLQGKELSYNNYLDLDAAYRAAWMLGTGPASMPGCAIVKHTNPCGLAQATTQADAFSKALAGDPVSAFGGIIGFNTRVEASTAEAIRASKLFVECIAAPSFDAAAKDILIARENLRLVEVPHGDPTPALHTHRIGGGMLVQEVDMGISDPHTWQVVTEKKVSALWLQELAFAMRAVAVLKSNAIVITREMMLLGAGAGQMSRVDAAQQAISKAGAQCNGAFMASDAFFPFDDCVRLAKEAGIVAIAQPGGSKRDQDSIDACNAAGIAMVFTGRRHFRH